MPLIDYNNVVLTGHKFVITLLVSSTATCAVADNVLSLNYQPPSVEKNYMQNTRAAVISLYRKYNNDTATDAEINQQADAVMRSVEGYDFLKSIKRWRFNYALLEDLSLQED